jgi:hypothetical protein
MSKIVQFESMDEKETKLFFHTIEDTMEWADETIFIGHKEGYDLVVASLGKDYDRANSNTYLIGVLAKALISTILNEVD